MTNLEIIHSLKKLSFSDINGAKYSLNFLPGLTNEELEHLKFQFPSNTIDKELLEVLKETKGWESKFDTVLFDSIGEFGFWELSPYSVTLGQDGLGNSWILDIDKNGHLGKVFFACHDPAVFVIHSQNLNEYLSKLLSSYQGTNSSFEDEARFNSAMAIWDNDNLYKSKKDFLFKNQQFAKFINQFEGEEWTVADLREGRNDTGFAWGKFGSNQYTKRHEKELIWIFKNKKKSIFSRIFG